MTIKMAFDYDVRIQFDQGFTTLDVTDQASDADAIITAMKMMKRKMRSNGYRNIKSVEIVRASHEQYR